MEEMKNLVIQTLETRGVLGQIRAKLRSSVFKIVDEQDQRTNPPIGCGLKWENNLLYKIKDTNVGGLISELIREYMEYLKMDYSLSVFIPECSISPERLKKEEIFAKLGLKTQKFNSELPIIFFIINYFIESLQSNPEKVYESLINYNQTDAEKFSDDQIMRNLYNYQTSNNENENFMNERGNNVVDDKIEENLYENENELNTNNGDAGEVNTNNNKFEKLNDVDISKGRSFEYEDRRNVKSKLDDSYEKIYEQSQSIEKFTENSEPNQKENHNFKTLHKESNSQNFNNNTDNDDIIEEIMIEDEDFNDKSIDKKNSGGSNNNFTISQSGGYDGTVDSNALETYNYIEPIEK